MRTLPDKHAMLAACRGLPTTASNPMIEAAAELALLHQTREQTPHCRLGDVDQHRLRLMRSVDHWIALVIPVPSPEAKLHTHTAGQVVDQLAELTTLTFVALANAPEPVFYDAKVRLDEIGDAYQDLIDELLLGQRRLPGAPISDHPAVRSIRDQSTPHPVFSRDERKRRP
ncbi:hypothetical protein [Nocardia pseudovaccinii]|uniref:hypothetical protein n=1 Tax=Nocardia pseudovaccinii TaxID=189540 RepID=UPI0007C82406|nr:hypothetical protein [Nocardia pseudovaccinii]